MTVSKAERSYLRAAEMCSRKLPINSSGDRACECGRTHVPNIKSLPHPHKILRR